MVADRTGRESGGVRPLCAAGNGHGRIRRARNSFEYPSTATPGPSADDVADAIAAHRCELCGGAVGRSHSYLRPSPRKIRKPNAANTRTIPTLAISRSVKWCLKNRMSTLTTTAISATTYSATPTCLVMASFYTTGRGKSDGQWSQVWSASTLRSAHTSYMQRAARSNRTLLPLRHEVRPPSRRHPGAIPAQLLECGVRSPGRLPYPPTACAFDFLPEPGLIGPQANLKRVDAGEAMFEVIGTTLSHRAEPGRGRTARGALKARSRVPGTEPRQAQIPRASQQVVPNPTAQLVQDRKNPAQSRLLTSCTSPQGTFSAA